MKIKNLSKKLIPLIFFSAFACYSQQSLRNFAYSKDKLIKSEFSLKQQNIEDKTIINPFLNISGNIKSRNAKINETISSDFPLVDEIKYFLNFYYNLSEGYQEFKRLRNSLSSYEFLNNDFMDARLCLVNLRNLRNFSDWGVFLNLRIKTF